MGIQGEFFEKPEPRVPEIVDEPVLQTRDEPLTDNHETDMVMTDATSFPAAETVNGAHLNGAHVASTSGPVRQAPAKPSVKRGLKDLSIPKLYYSISEVSRLTGLEPYVLRYWETEFDELNPQKNRAGNRIYSNKDIKFILRIKELLREQRYTIEGAKHILRDERTSEKERPAPLEATSPDPDQIVLPTEPKSAPSTPISLSDIQEMKASLTALRNVLASR
jgi:DNA-binding transcriptional MerR regulator